MARFAAAHVGCCPFLDTGDRLCESHFSLGRLSEAFGDCFGDYQRCPNYARLSGLDRAVAPAAPAAPARLTDLTRHGRRLQATGP